MATKFEAKWNLWIEKLKDRVPLSKPVTVKRLERGLILPSASAATTKAEPQLGYANIVNRRFEIGISSVEPKSTQLDTLLHEWAHCLAYPDQRKAKTVWKHDDIYGIAYAKVYREFFEEPEP